MLRRISRQFAPSWRIRKPARLHRWRSRPILRLGRRLRLNPAPAGDPLFHPTAASVLIGHCHGASRCASQTSLVSVACSEAGSSGPSRAGLYRACAGGAGLFRLRPLCARRSRRSAVCGPLGNRPMNSRLASAERVQVRFDSSPLNRLEMPWRRHASLPRNRDCPLTVASSACANTSGSSPSMSRRARPAARLKNSMRILNG